MSVNMLNHQLVTDGTPAEGLQGRVVVLDERNAKAITAATLLTEEQKYRDAAKAGSQIPRWMGARLGEAKEEIPDLNGAGGRQIAKAYADDYHHLSEVVKARSEGRYQEFKNEDGSRERGIVVVNGQEKQREGMWIAKDADSRVRQIATFHEGKPDGSVRNFREDGSLESSSYYKDGIQVGSAYKYDEKSRVVHKEEWDSGTLKTSQAVDPALAAEQRTQMRAVNSMKVGR